MVAPLKCSECRCSLYKKEKPGHSTEQLPNNISAFSFWSDMSKIDNPASAGKEAPKEVDYTLKNPDTLTKYKIAGEISTRVLSKVSELCTPGSKIIEICAKGDAFILEETNKVYKGKSVLKGIAFPTSLSVNQVAAHFSPLPSDPEAQAVLNEGDLLKISLGAQIDGFGSILGRISSEHKDTCSYCQGILLLLAVEKSMDAKQMS